MDMTPLDSLSDEDLEKEIAARKDRGGDPIAQLVQVIQTLMQEVQAQREKLDKLCADYYDELLGTIDKMYKVGARAEGLKGFGEKHGAMLGPFADDFKRTYDDDLMEKAYDYMEGLKGGDGYTDEGGDKAIAELADQIKQRLGKNAEVKVEATKVEPVASPASGGEADGMPSDVVDEIARQKKKDAARAEARKRA